MAIAKFGVLDLSIVTDRLIALVKMFKDASPLLKPPHTIFDINVTGNAPDAVRGGDECGLGMFLFHVTPNRFNRNISMPALRHAEISFEPLSLDLYYLVHAFAKDDYVKEQVAMSIALLCLHQNPIVRTTVSF